MSYDLQSLQAPRLAGGALAAFVAALEFGPTRALILPKILADSGFTAFRGRALSEAPAPHPQLERLALADDGATVAPVAEQIEALAGAAMEPGQGFRFVSLMDLHRAYQAGETTPLAVAERVIENLAGAPGDGQLRSMIAWSADDIRQQAQASAARWEAGAPLSVFDGVPVAVKDELDVIGYPTTVGTRFLGGAPKTEDATTAARLRALGAVLIGKANMHEIGIGVTGLNPHHGTARNPYQPAHHTGGSSSGSAAAVAAGLCPLSIGADGGGSIRTPAALCGLVGLKATWSRVSEHGAAPLCWSVAHVGPIGATVQDCALGYLAMAGPDERDPQTLGQPAVRVDDLENPSLAGLKLGVYRPWYQHAEPEVVAACDRVLELARAAGATVHEIELPELELCRVAHTVTIAGEMATAMDGHYGAHRRDFGLDVRTNLVAARAFTTRDYVRAQQARARITGIWAAAFEQVDLIVTPTTGAGAPPIAPDALERGESDLPKLAAIMRFVVPANLIGIPAITFPAGYTSAGLPIGFQAMGRAWSEHQLLSLARVAERGVVRTPPQVHAPLLG